MFEKQWAVCSDGQTESFRTTDGKLWDGRSDEKDFRTGGRTDLNFLYERTDGL